MTHATGHYYTKQGPGAGMRMLPGRDAGIYYVKIAGNLRPMLTKDAYDSAQARFRKNETQISIASTYGVSKYTLLTAIKNYEEGIGDGVQG